MKKILSLTIFILSILIISGCTTAPGGIPDAKSDETYTATIPTQGAGPFTCKQVGATDIGGTLTIDQSCVISGTAPHAVETKVIAFKVEITDANGNTDMRDMTLTVHPPPVNLELDDRIVAKLGEKFTHSFAATGGNPPYTFTVSGQPMGLIMNLNGELQGTIPELAREGEYPTEVCVKDTKGASDCGNTIIDVGGESEETANSDKTNNCDPLCKVARCKLNWWISDTTEDKLICDKLIGCNNKCNLGPREDLDLMMDCYVSCTDEAANSWS